MSNPNDPGPRLAAWRADHDPKITLQSCADAVGVKHPTWLDWENGNRSPGLEKALAIELFTDGAIKIEAWGFDAKVFETIRSVIARRDESEPEPVFSDLPTPPALPPPPAADPVAAASLAAAREALAADDARRKDIVIKAALARKAERDAAEAERKRVA